MDVFKKFSLIRSYLKYRENDNNPSRIREWNIKDHILINVQAG